MSERSYYFDNLKFILILLVVLGHAFEPFIDDKAILPIYLFIYSFHMPLFIFISGYFSKNINSSQYAAKLVNKLVIPYILFESLYSLFYYWIDQQEQLTFTYFTPTWIMWFLFSMIIWKLVLPVVVKLKYILPIAAAAAILIGYANDVAYYASLSRIITLFPFFLAGYFTKEHWLERLKTRAIKIAALIAMSLIFIAFCFNAERMKIELFYYSLPYKLLDYNVWYAGAYRLGAMLLAVILGTCLLSLVSKHRIPWISNAGRNTIYVFLLHGFVIKWLVAMDVPSRFDSLSSKLLVIMFAILLTLLLSSPIISKVNKSIIYSPLLIKEEIKSRTY